jgi:DNA-binding CsgD family transcriptional regulator
VGADPFVGRETENAALDAALGDAWSGRGRLFLVAGEPGIGKSRLAGELTVRARDAGAQVGWGRCWEAGGAPAYWPWAEVLATLVDRIGVTELRARLGDSTDDLGQIIPALAAEAPDARLAPDTARFRLYDAVVRLCRLATVDAPMVAVVDDAHVADPSSLLLLQFLAGQLDTMGLVVVATYRDSEATGNGFADVVAQLVRERTTTRLRLGGLDAEGVSEVIGAATGVGPSPQLVARVREVTDGNPLYVGEAARLLATEGRLDDAIDPDRLLIPRDVRETVLRRLSQLSDRCHRVLELASVLGRDFPLDVLAVLAGEEIDVMSELDEAARATVVVDSPGRAGHLRFAHAVMSEALYREIPSLRRRRLHDEAGRALEVLRGTDLGPRLAELARHCYASLPVGPVDRAVMSSRLAGERAVQQLAYEEGARLFDMALQALAGAAVPMAATNEEWTDLLLALGDALSKGGDMAAAKAAFLDAADLARQSANAEQLARAALGYGGRFVWMRAGTDAKVIPLLRDALTLLSEDDSELRVRLLARLAGAKRDEPSMEARDALSAEAVEIAARIGDPGTSAYALIARGLAISGPRAAQELRVLGEEAVRLAELAGHQEHAAAGRLVRFMAVFATGPGELVRPALDEYTRLAEELRQPSHRWYSDVVRASVLLLEGRLEAAESLMDAAQAAGQKAQSWDAEATHLQALTMLRWEEGRLGEMEEHLVSAGSMYPGYRLFGPLLALARLETGRREEALGLAAEILHGGEERLPLDNGWLFGMTMLAEVTSRVGDRELASLQYVALEPFAAQVGTGANEIASGSIHRPLGQLASVLGRTDDALAHFEAAQVVHRAYRADIWITHTDIDEATARLRRGSDEDRRRAAKLVEAAAECSRREGWPALAARAEELTQTLQRDERTALPGGLTRREVEVARLVAQGRSNREMAEQFVLSERTVETHVQHILTKLGFTSRSEIAAWAVRSGLSDDA